MPRLEENEMLLVGINNFELIEGDDFKFFVLASKEKDEEDVNDAEDDDFIEEEEEGENPFDKEPTEKDLIENDVPIIDPEDDLLDDDEEVPYN